MKEVLKCLSSRATKPSPLKPCLRLLELQRLHSALTSEAVTSIAEGMCIGTVHYGKCQEMLLANEYDILSELPAGFFYTKVVLL